VTGIPDDAVVAFNWAATEWSTYCDDAVRAGLAAALPHLADACDALRAAERSGVSTATQSRDSDRDAP
jgi:hypothetical protein